MIKSHYPWSHGLARLHDKLKTLYIHYHSGHGHQIGRVATYHERHLPIKPHDDLIKCSWGIKWETKTISPIDPSVMWCSEVALHLNTLYLQQTWQSSYLHWKVSPTKVTELFRYDNIYGHQTFQVGNKPQGPPAKLQVTLIMWLWDVTWQIRCVIYPLAEVLLARN